MALEAGQRIDDRYTLVHRLGSGGMAEVWLATDEMLGRRVALKFLDERFGQDAQFVERFRREAQAAAGLQHPNIVGVFDRGETQNRHWIAMEYVEGASLKDLIMRGLSVGEAVELIRQILTGAKFAHEHGIIHRDFKPENVLVDREGRARVADFGLASSATGGAAGVSLRASPMAFMSVTGTLSGTPAYMAPELVDGVRPHEGSDQFAFAVTLFEAVHGRYPFDGKTAEAIWTNTGEHRITRGERRVPGWLDRCLRRALSPDPADRFPDLAAMLDEIERRSRRSIFVPLAI